MESTENCIRCGCELTLDVCGEEFLETGVCVDCWIPEDEEDELAPEHSDREITGKIKEMKESIDNLQLGESVSFFFPHLSLFR